MSIQLIVFLPLLAAIIAGLGNKARELTRKLQAAAEATTAAPPE